MSPRDQKPRAVVLLSGGLDSTVLLYHLRSIGYEVVEALTVHYGQRHHCELGAAGQIAEEARIPFRIVDLSAIREHIGGSSQTDAGVPVPMGHYADKSMKATVVPNRNMMLLSVALARAVVLDAPFVAYAAHAGDHPIYPDCRPAFVGAMNEAARLCDYKPRRIIRPFIDSSKAFIARLGAELKAPLHLTWSCYVGQDRHCGTCGTCVERREAFQLAGVEDPTDYAA